MAKKVHTNLHKFFEQVLICLVMRMN